MPNNIILTVFHVLSKNSMAFSRPEYLATMLPLQGIPIHRRSIINFPNDRNSNNTFRRKRKKKMCVFEHSRESRCD